MNRKVWTSLLVIGMALAAIAGGTLAWFTAEVKLDDNVFTAGTVTLDAEDSWENNANLVVDNWNPGDFSPKYIAVEYTGNKRAFMRMQISGVWEEELPNTNVKWKVYIGEEDYTSFYDTDGKWVYDWATAAYSSLKAWFDDENEWKDFDLNNDLNWHYYDGWYYFAGGTDTNTTIKLGDNTIIKAIDPNNPDDPGTDVQVIIHAVYLDGPGTGNEYQGKKYIVSAKFQAIQASHAGEWTWDDFDNYN